MLNVLSVICVALGAACVAAAAFAAFGVPAFLLVVGAAFVAAGLVLAGHADVEGRPR